MAVSLHYGEICTRGLGEKRLTARTRLDEMCELSQHGNRTCLIKPRNLRVRKKKIRQSVRQNKALTPGLLFKSFLLALTCFSLPFEVYPVPCLS